MSVFLPVFSPRGQGWEDIIKVKPIGHISSILTGETLHKIERTLDICGRFLCISSRPDMIVLGIIKITHYKKYYTMALHPGPGVLYCHVQYLC